jgi:hypothetical protein
MARGIGRIIYVDGNRVRDVALESSRNLSDIMALVIAHEVGHLLRLPHDARSRSSIMRAEWSIADLRRIDVRSLHFTPAELDGIRASIQARQRPSDSTQSAQTRTP